MKNIVIKTPRGKRIIGPGQPCFIIAEMSANHHLKFSEAIKIIDAAKASGADAVKMQTYTADTMTINCDNKYFQVNVNKAWKGQTLYELYEKAYTPWEWQSRLKKYGESKGLVVFSTPFDPSAVDFLEKLNVPLYKVASFELTDIPLFKKIGKTRKPVIIARGMGSEKEIKMAIRTLKEAGSPSIAVLHCLSSYPAIPEEMNIKTVASIPKKFGVVTGLSDHSLGNNAAIAAVSLGASIIEKHLILKRSSGGPDAGFSLEPKEFKELVVSVREVEKSLGKAVFTAGKRERENKIFRRSLFAVKDIKKGEKISKDNISSIRPGYGLLPVYYDKVMGMMATANIKRGTPLSWKLIK